MLGLIAVVAMASCSDNDNSWETYYEWRQENKTWFAEQENKLNADGSAYYERVAGVWSPKEYVLVHWFNNREETKGNLTPKLTSQVTTRYIGRMYNDVAFDSSYNNVDALSTFKVSGVIEGWQIALQNMHVGDSVELVIPYSLAYGSSSTGSIYPYSALRFNMSLVDIPNYETRE